MSNISPQNQYNQTERLSLKEISVTVGILVILSIVSVLLVNLFGDKINALLFWIFFSIFVLISPWIAYRIRLSEESNHWVFVLASLVAYIILLRIMSWYCTWHGSLISFVILALFITFNYLIDKKNKWIGKRVPINFIIILLLGIVICIVEFNNIWFIYEIVILTPVITYVVFSLKLDQIAILGKKMWTLTNIWFVVFVFGAYIALSNIAKQVIVTAQPLTPEILFTATRDTIMAAFLAVVTSVMAHIFGNISESAQKTEEAVRQISNQERKLRELNEEIQGLTYTFKSISRFSQNATRLYGLITKGYELAKNNNDLKCLRDAIRSLADGMNKFDERALFPLLPPGAKLPSKEEDTLAKLVEDLEDTNNQKHCAYMSAAIGRYLQAEADERRYPGVLLNLTSLVYYAQTVRKIVESLEAWPSEFEFYTLMPKSPASMFRFTNSMDITDWLDFLKFYNSVQTVSEKKWVRYFAYFDNDTMQEFIKKGKLKNEFNKGFVYKGDNTATWEPKVINHQQKQDIINQYIEADSDDHDMAFSENNFSSGNGTLVVKSHITLPSPQWEKLENVLISFQGSVNSFRYREMRTIKDIFQYRLEIQEKKMNGEYGNIRKFYFPKDIFALRKKSSDESENNWKLLVGLDEGSIDTGVSGLNLAFSPVFDLDVMSDNSSGEINNKAAKEIRGFLQQIFFGKGSGPLKDKGILTHDEFIAS